VRVDGVADGVTVAHPVADVAHVDDTALDVHDGVAGVHEFLTRRCESRRHTVGNVRVGEYVHQQAVQRPVGVGDGRRVTNTPHPV